MSAKKNEKGCFLTVCLNPTLQKTVLLDTLTEDSVNRSKEHAICASGKGINVSRVLVQLGERVIHLTHAGGWNRELFLGLCAEDAIDVRWVDSGSEIRFCYTLLSSARHTTTEIVEEAVSVANGTEAAVYEAFCALLNDAHTVIISGTKASGYSDALYPRFVSEAKKAGKAVILDIRGKDLLGSLEHEPDVIKPNYEEFASTFENGSKKRSVSEETIIAKMIELYKTYRITSVISHGSEACLFTDKGEVKRAFPRVITPVNVTGSGDAFCAGFASRYAITQDAESSVSFGMECAFKNALLMKPGVIG